MFLKNRFIVHFLIMIFMSIKRSSFKTVFKAIFKQCSIRSVCFCYVIIVKDFVIFSQRKPLLEWLVLVISLYPHAYKRLLFSKFDRGKVSKWGGWRVLMWLVDRCIHFIIFNHCKFMTYVKTWNFKCMMKKIGLIRFLFTKKERKKEREKEGKYWPMVYRNTWNKHIAISLIK